MYTGKCAVANGVEILKLRQLLASLKLDWDIVLEDGMKRSSTNNSVENTTKMVEYENESDPSKTDDDDLWALPPILFEQPKTPTKVKIMPIESFIKCSYGCTNRCNDHLSQWSQKEKEDLRSRFADLNNVKT